MKSKKEHIQDAWIHISRRQPEINSEEIWVWNPITKRSYLVTGEQVYSAIRYMLDTENFSTMSITPDKRISHWMPVIPPC